MGIELSRRFLHGDGAQRVHGGGLPALIQAYVPLARRSRLQETDGRRFRRGELPR